MLHALLIILRVIGIILLVILAVLILLVLAVLFVPVRYRVNVVKDGGPLTAGARAEWFLKALGAEASWTEDGGSVRIRFLCFTLKTFRLPGVRGSRVADDEIRSPGESRQSAHDSVNTEIRPDEQIPMKTDIKSSSWHEQSRPDSEDSQDEPPGGGRSLFEKAAESLEKAAGILFDILLQIPGFPADVISAAEGLAEKLEKKIASVRRKAGPFLTAQADHVYLEILDCLKYLLRGWKIRKAEGYLEFGTGGPDTTGAIAGLVYVILPADSRGYRLEPDFYESCFRTDTSLEGRARMYRLAYVGIRLFRDKEFRRLLHKIRGADAKRKK